MKKSINKEFIKIISILAIFCILFISFNNNFSYANSEPILLASIASESDHFNPDEYKPNESMTDQEGETVLKDIGNAIIGPIRVFGSFASVLALIIIGIKYMLGSVEEKAEYKKTLTPYLIGAAMVFGIVNMVGFIYDIAKNI